MSTKPKPTEEPAEDKVTEEGPAPEAAEESVEALPSKPKQEPDRVAMVSLRADGTPDQTEDHEVLGDPAEG